MADDQDVWVKFKSTFTQLYVSENKTLQEVKATMENNHGFPVTPLSTYETRLRDKLHLRKNLKAKEWLMIYNFVNTNRLNQFDCYFHGILIPRTKVRKEFRRYRSRTVAQPLNPSAPLPHGIEVREQRAPDRLPNPYLPIRGPSAPPEVNMPDVADENTSIVPYSPPRLSPASQCSDLPVDFGLCSPVIDMNTWGAASIRGTQSALSRNATPADGFMDEFVNSSLSMSSTPGFTASGEVVLNDLSETPVMIAPHNSTIQRPIHHTTSTSRDRRLYAKYHLQSLPWIRYRLSLQALRGGSGQATFNTREVDGWSLAVMPADGFFEHSHHGLPVLISNTAFPITSKICESRTSSGALSTHFDPFYILAEVVYLFSNSLHGYHDHELATQLFDNLVRRVPRELFLTIFKSNEPSIRAVWENLFNIASDNKVRIGLQLLITIGLRLQADWIDDRREDVLFAAVSIGDTSLVKQLLERWHSWNPGSRTHPTCFGAAADCGAIDCARLLLEYCDLNANITISLHFRIIYVSIFTLFLSDFGNAFERRDRNLELQPSESLPAYADILALFVKAGADVDMPYPSMVFGDDHFGWGMSCLDICFYLAGPAFENLTHSSRLWNSEITRAGVCNALLQGQDGLAEYLESRPAPPAMKASQCLRIILIEQFDMSDQDKRQGYINYLDLATMNSVGRANRYARARALLEYGASMRAWHEWDPTSGLNIILQSAACDGLDGDLSYLLDHSIKSGADIGPDAYDACIRETGTSVLRTLILLDIDFQDNGGVALLKAARRNNYEAVSFLLEEGVDINSEVYVDNHGYRRPIRPITILSHLLISERNPKPDFGKTQRMWKIFVENGAKLRLHRGHATCYQLLREIVQSATEFWGQAFQFVLSSDKDIPHLPNSKWANLLELSVSKSRIDSVILQTLFRHCGSISEPLLAQAIMKGCDLAFMHELLYAGQDVNEYSGGYSPLQAACARLDIDKVTRLLERGAEVNSPTENEVRDPHFWRSFRGDPLDTHDLDDIVRPGMTVLQLACGCHPLTQEMRKRQEHLVKLLVHHGADINAKAHGKHASTALQLLCAKDYTDPSVAHHIRGLIEFFLENGADVNIAPSFCGYSALQHCAKRGDIGQAVILVQNGVDPNAHPHMEWKTSEPPDVQSALDLAASHGRLDMTQYLLNIGAFSATIGKRGYRGAVRAALNKSHHAIAKIIRSHIKKLVQDSRHDPQMRTRHRELIKKHADLVDKRKAEFAQFYDHPRYGPMMDRG